MTNELITKAKECKSAEELLALAKENNVEMTEKQAAEFYAKLHNEGELSDNELDGAAGGGCYSEEESILPGDKITFKDGYTCSCGSNIFIWEGISVSLSIVYCADCGEKHRRSWNVKVTKYK